MDSLCQELAVNGFALLAKCDAPIEDFLEAVTRGPDHGIRIHCKDVHAVRNLMAVPAVRDWITSAAVRAIIEPILGEDTLAVRGILFDKTPAANWKVPWHQDRSIAVKEKASVAGFGPWSLKAGVVHVQPPAHVLQSMCTLRLHLDDCGPDNGPLKVVPGSHSYGILPERETADRVVAGPIVPCCVPRGGAVLVRPLLLHASSSANQPGHRRVIHIEFANVALPASLTWADAVPMRASRQVTVFH